MLYSISALFFDKYIYTTLMQLFAKLRMFSRDVIKTHGITQRGQAHNKEF